ncbi:hypothetical protein [Paenibacillus sp. FSL R5-0345]|nr:hypothetical protein [Paenibacillus sp. FSL R5-0345]
MEYQCGEELWSSSLGASLRLAVRTIHRRMLLGCDSLTATNQVKPAGAIS